MSKNIKQGQPLNYNIGKYSRSQRVRSYNNLKRYGSFKSEEVYKVLPKLERAINRGSGSLVNSVSHEDIDIENEFLKYRTTNTNVDYSITGYNYIFMTKPKLNLKTSGNSYNMKHSFFKFIQQNHPDLIKSLTYLEGGGNFIPIITNLYDRFDVDDIMLNDTTASETWRGYQQRLPTHSVDSINGGTFSITYDELQTPLVTYLHKIWIDYIENVKFGMMEPTQLTMQNKEIDYVSSLYYFFLEPDGQTIRFWGKYTGVTPKSLPYSAFSGERGNPAPVKATIQYLYSYREFLEPEILQEFNNVSKGENIVSSSKFDLIETGNKFLDFADRILTPNPKEARGNRVPSGSSIPDGPMELSGVGMEGSGFNNVGIKNIDGDFKLIFY